MANQIIEIPGVGPVEFPDTMPDADIAAAAKKLHADAEAKLDTMSKPTDVQHLPASQSVPGIIGGMGSQILNTVKALPSAAYNLATTDPRKSVPAMVSGLYHEPGAIQEQFAKGTPKDVGEAMMRTVMMMAPVAAAAKPVAAGVSALSKTPVGAAAKAAIAETPIISAPIKAAAKAYKAAKATPEEGLLSTEADALRASTAVKPPVGTANPMRGKSAPPAPKPAAPAVVDTPVSAKARAAQAAEADAARLRQHTADAETAAARPMGPATDLGPNATPTEWQFVQRSPEGDWYVDPQGSHHLVNPESPAPASAGIRTAQDDTLSQMHPNWSPNITSSGVMRSEGLPETFEAQLAARADDAFRAQEATAGSRLTPKPAAGPSEDVLNSMQVAEPTADVNTLGSKLGQVSEAQAGAVDPEVEAIVAQMRARNQPQSPSVPSHVGGHQTEAVPGSARTARSVYEPGGSQALTEEELMQLLYDIEQNRIP